MRWARTIGGAAFALAAIGSGGLSSAPARAASWAPNDDDALLLDMRVNQYKLGDGVRGYATPGGVCVDLADALLALDVPVRLDKMSRRATGWAFDERHTITIDRNSGLEHIMNQGKASDRKVAPDDIYDTKQGWCVAAPALARWLGVDLRADPANAVLVVRAGFKLPAELAAERRARVATQRVSFDLASLPHASTPRRFTAPALDVVASFAAVSDRRTGGRIEARYELFASGEAGPVSYDARLSSDRNGAPQALRVRAYRTDPEGKLPLGATTIAAGDVAGLSTPLVAQASVGRGAMITNRPVDRPENFARTDFRGDLPRGWDAELYRNGQLLAFANDRADGRYEFLDVPLQYGDNVFEIVLYGPQGQVRRETRVVPVGLESIPPKKTWFWAGVDDDGRDLIDLGGARALYRRGWRGSVGVERGLDVRTSVAAFAHSLRLDDGLRHDYLEGAVRRAFGGALVEASASKDWQGGLAWRGAMLGAFGKTHIAAETIWATGNYRSDRVTSGVVGLHQLTLDRVFGDGRTSVPVHLDARYTARGGGGGALDLGARASANLGRTSLTGEVGWTHDRRPFGPDPPDVVEAGLLANARIAKVRVRGEARFRLAPQSRFESATAVAEWTSGSSLLAPAEWRAEIGYDRALHRGRAGLGYIRRFGAFLINAGGEVASDGSVAGSLSLAFSLGPDPRRHGGIRVSSDKLAAQGSTLVSVYRDLNANGRRDPGEPGEKGVIVSAGRVPVDRPTDAAGEVVVDGLEPYRPALIGVDASSLPDPLVQPKDSGLVVTPRPGVAATVELGLVASGDVDGTLLREGGGVLEGVDLELVDVEGHVARTARSDYDGFFIFEGVPYGRYTVRVAKLSADASRINAALTGQATVGAATPSAHLGAVAARPLATVAAK